MCAKKISIKPKNICAPVGPYSHGIIAKGGRLLFIAGQVAWGPDGEIIGKGDFEAQARQVMENIKIVLEASGATFDNIVKIVNYLTDCSNYPILKRVRSEYIKGDPPVSTLIEVKSLMEKDLMVEVDAIAVLD